MKHLRIIIAMGALALAHGDFDHVQGTVVKLENSALTVKTTQGNETVKLNAKTEIMRVDKAAAVADLRADTKVVVDIPEGDKTRGSALFKPEA